MSGTLSVGYSSGMKSCLGLLAVLTVFILVVGGGGLIWYLSETAEFSRTDGSGVESAPPPKAIPRAEPPRPSGNAR